MYRGPLSKMIDEAANEKAASMLKNVEGGRVAGRTEHVKFDQDDIQLPDEYYQDMGFESRDDYIKQQGRGQVDIEENRQASNQFYNSANKVSMNNLSDVQKNALTEMYGDQVGNLQVYEKDGTFYLDQGTHHTNEKGFATPIEITDEAFQVKDQAATKESGEQEKEEVNLDDAQIIRFGGDGGKLHAFSKSNPHVNNDMSKKDLNEARKWERVNDTQFKRGGSNRFGGGSGKTSTEQQTLSDARNVKRTSGDIQPPTNKLKYANPSHMLNKRTMSFRKKR
jgi:ubiquitin